MVTNVTDSKCYSFPTRRSSDLRLSRSERRHPAAAAQPAFDDNLADENHNSVYRDYHYQRLNMGSAPGLRSIHPDRKSTRLNSSHVAISYAVFSLKKKISLTYLL